MAKPLPSALLSAPAFLGHETGAHPENPRRLVAVTAELERADLIEGRPTVSFGPAEFAAVERVHDPRYVELLRTVAESGGAWLDGDTMVAADSFEIAFLAAGAALAAVDASL